MSMSTSIRKIGVLIFLGAFVTAMSGCNTIKGVGKDTERLARRSSGKPTTRRTEAAATVRRFVHASPVG
jgi:predicted small secreted protein